MAKKAKASKYLPYPTPVKQRGGCKVSWNYYDNEDDAKACSDAARRNAQLQAALGYDFGYCAPGSIEKKKPDAIYKEFGKDLEVGGLFEVCLP